MNACDSTHDHSLGKPHAHRMSLEAVDIANSMPGHHELNGVRILHVGWFRFHLQSVTLTNKAMEILQMTKSGNLDHHVDAAGRWV